ncbi:MAG TPA: glycolate oxidase subunit GlcE [Casimicrobiaceae bacterium]|nr:glycolate oxidase subunit GlcE [Casimicrobiaceae bacterium]
MPERAIQALQDAIRRAAATHAPVRVRGGGTKDFYGERLAGDVLDLRPIAGIVDYAPTELVITARAGTPLEELEATMHDAGQMLAFEPPRFAPGGTLGGAIASGLSGPRRPYAGAARDVVLGVKIVDGTGRALAFGGRVMKNVAGFDVSRLMTGAMGTLGVITEVSLKCLPRPRVEATRQFELSADESIRRVNEWGGQPLPLSATCFHQGRLAVRLSGAPSAVSAACARLGGTEVADADDLWASVRDQRHAFFAGAQEARAPVWRLSVGSTAPYTDLGGEQLVEWGGALRWLAATPRTDAAKVRAWAQSYGGHATLFRAADRDAAGPSHGARPPGGGSRSELRGDGGTPADVFTPLPPALAGLHKRLKATFDPHGILNPGRLSSVF